MTDTPQLLYVEDDAYSRKLMAFVFAQQGVGLRCVASGAECLEVLLTMTPDLVLMDAYLGDATGVSLCTTLASQSAAPKVVFLSSAEAEGVFRDGKPEIVVGFIRKPVDTATIVDEVLALARGPIASDLPDVEPSPVLERLRQDYLLHLNSKRLELLTLWLPHGRAELESLVQEVHKVAGTSGLYGLADLSREAQALENYLRFNCLDAERPIELEGSRLFTRLMRELMALCTPSAKNPAD